uniref:Uncharacterized protein n=1 Tax=Klebsiella pneumoniae TaxID=573 RepID=A0A8B0SNE9_KLEPN|nr:hypothetical protein [Klebsiella pneumoniae]
MILTMPFQNASRLIVLLNPHTVIKKGKKSYFPVVRRSGGYTSLSSRDNLSRH